jgi:hypothetical protein
MDPVPVGLDEQLPRPDEATLLLTDKTYGRSDHLDGK